MASTTTTSRRLVAPVLFVVLVLLAASEMGTMMKVAEARDCVSQSHHFKGPCVSSTNCHHVCKTEGFPSGACSVHFFRRKCYCKTHC